MIAKQNMELFLINKMNGIKNMNKLLWITLFSSLCGCAVNNNVSFPSLKIVNRINEKNTDIIIGFDDDTYILSCETTDDNVRVEEFLVNLFVEGNGELVIAEDGELQLKDSNIEAAIMNMESGTLYVSRNCFRAHPHYEVRCLDSLDGKGCITSELVFIPSIQLPRNIAFYDCIGYDVGINADGEKKKISVYHFKSCNKKLDIKSLIRVL